MTEQLNSEHLAEVIPLRGRRDNGVERINGVKMRLGAMSVESLTELAGTCRERLEEARLDLAIVSDYLDARDPDGGDAA